MPVIINTGALAKASNAVPFDTGFVNFLSTGTAPAPGGNVGWTGTANALTQNGVGAQTVSTFDTFTTYIFAQNLNMPDIPAGAVVTGLQVRYLPVHACCQNIYDASIRVFQGGAPVGNDAFVGFVHWPPCFCVFFTRFGGAGDTAGLTLSGADINSPTFGFGIQALHKISTGGFLSFEIAYIDVMQMRILYTAIP